MQPNLIILETLSNGNQRTHHLSHLHVITAQGNARYVLIDAATGKIPAGLVLQREGNSLKVLVHNETIVQINDFYNQDMLAEFSTDGAVASNDNVLISASSSEESADLTGASSGDAFDSITTGQAIYSLGMFLAVGATAVAESRNNDSDDVVVPFAAPTTALATDSGSSTSDFITNDSTFNVTDVEEGATWEYSTDGGTTWATGVGSSFELTDNTTYAAGDIQIHQINSFDRVSATASNSSPVVIDSVAPEVIYTSASYNASSNTISISGLNLNTLLTSDESSTTNILANFNWTKLEWDFDSDDTSNVSFSEDDISSAKVLSDTLLSITLNSATASTIEGTSGFDPLDVDDQIEISNGFSRDTAGNTAIDDAFTSFPGDESIVVFDLIAGHSSWHSARIFDADIAYTIYIIVNSSAASVMMDAGEVWSGGENLGNDDVIRLAGSGSALLGAKSGTVNPGNISHATFGYVWQTAVSDLAAGIVQHSGLFTRVAPGTVSDTTRIFVASSTQAFQLYGGGKDDTMPAGIMTSQGLIYV